MSTLITAKLRALSLHFALSLLVLAPLLWVIWFRWYPPPMFFTDGGWQGLRILAPLHLLAAPALTFVVYSPTKSRRALTVDFVAIGAVQAAALVGGTVMIESMRPWTLSYDDGAYHTLNRQVYAEQSIEPSEWARLGTGPIYRVYTRAPATESERSGAVAHAFFSGLEPSALFFLHDPLAPHLDEVRAHALDIESLGADNASLRAEAEAMQAAHDEPLWYLPLYGYFANAIVAIGKQGNIVGALYREPPTSAHSD